MACPCCGVDVSFELNEETEGIYSFGLSIGGVEIDVTTFESGRAGDTIVCKDDVTLTVNSYCIIDGVSVGDTDVPWEANVCGTAISGNATATVINIDATATGTPTWTYTLKVTGTITGV